MTSAIVRRLACWASLGCLAFALATAAHPLPGAEDKAPAKETTKKKAKPRASRGFHQLPPHYKDLVTDEQREEIYKIQDEYQPKIRALQAQLNTLKKEEKEKIEALLTPEQKEKIAEAKAKQKQRKPKAEKPAEKAPPPSSPAP